MNKLRRTLFSFFVIFVLFTSLGQATNLTLNNTPAQVCFSPNGDCTKAIVREIDNAKSEILVQVNQERMRNRFSVAKKWQVNRGWP